MEIGHWLSLFSICLLWAMSPGPSLAVVLNNTLIKGPGAGYSTAISHGLGVALYGLLTITGLAIVVTRSPALFLALQLLGATYLIYLGIRSLRGAGSNAMLVKEGKKDNRGHRAALSGFLMAFLNPKLALFMLALFAQFLNPQALALEKGIMVATVGITDVAWYSLIVTAVSQQALLERLKRSAGLIDRVFGVLLIVLALSVITRVLLPA